jgi:hypothetical protein
LVTPPAAAVIVTDVVDAVWMVVAMKIALVAPAATVTLTGTLTNAPLLLLSVTTTPPAGAAAPSTTIPRAAAPPTMRDGRKATPVSASFAGHPAAALLGASATSTPSRFTMCDAFVAYSIALACGNV